MSVVGLDFGEAGVELAYEHEGAPALLAESGKPNQSRLGAVVALEDQIAWVGQSARDRMTDLPRIKCLAGMKRALGRQSAVHVDAAGREWQAHGLTALPIRKLLRDYASHHLASDVAVVAAVPTCADEGYVRALKSACRLAGFSAVQAVDSSIAIACTSRRAEGTVIVLDAGVGRPCASIVRLDEGRPEVLHSEIGSVSIRERLAACLPSPFNQVAAGADGAPYELSESIDRLDALWEALQSPHGASGFWRARDSYYPFFVTGSVLQESLRAVVEDLAQLVQQALASHKRSAGEVQRIVGAGGWGRNQAVLRMLEDRLSAQGIAAEIAAAPAGAVAMGALQWHLRGHSGLRSRSDSTLGIRTRAVDGATRIEPLVGTEQPLPARASFPLFANRAGQKRFVIELAEGDADGQQRSLGFFTHECPAGVPLNHRLDCTLERARDGSVTMQAVDAAGEQRSFAVLGAPEIEDADRFRAQRMWIEGLALNETLN